MGVCISCVELLIFVMTNLPSYYRQYWINYKFLKKKINEIVDRSDEKIQSAVSTEPMEIAKNPAEQEFFRQVHKELRKTSDFFKHCQQEYAIRWARIWDSYVMLQEVNVIHEKNTWTRLLAACVRFYKDVLLLENFAIMNYCGFSKILKKHDKLTGYVCFVIYKIQCLN